MIQLLHKGTYQLIETREQTKILTLDGQQIFAWVIAEGIGEILVTSTKTHKTDQILAIGPYRLYGVENEPDLTDLEHLELFVGQGQWQGYLLPKGLPTETERRHRIIPTDETITERS